MIFFKKLVISLNIASVSITSYSIKKNNKAINNPIRQSYIAYIALTLRAKLITKETYK